jgi:ADP-ribosyl-[dinitrogen reductase] hydrolase
MRLVPVVIAYHYALLDATNYAQASTAVTHRSEDCLSASGLFGEMLFRALNGETDKHAVLSPPFSAQCTPILEPIIKGAYRHKDEDAISGSGWVVESLEAALWAFWRGADFKETVLLAANLGDDADTTGAIAGQLSGAFYGEESIPTKWRERLFRAEEIGVLSKRLLEATISNRQDSQ